MIDFSQAEDLNFEGGAIPEGTVVMLSILEVGALEQSYNKKPFFPIKFEVAEGKYAGKQIKERFYDTEGYPRQKIQTFGRYVLETTLNAHEKGPESYQCANLQALQSGKVVAKLGVRAFTGESGETRYTNEVVAYGTPRADSSNFKIYEAYSKGEQPWQTDELPKLEQKKSNGFNGAANNNASYEHATQNIAM